MTDQELKSADEWLAMPEFEGITVLDPDGWDRRGAHFEASWAERITKEEFNRRLFRSTLLMRMKTCKDCGKVPEHWSDAYPNVCERCANERNAKQIIDVERGRELRRSLEYK